MPNAQQQVRALMGEAIRQVGVVAHTPAGFIEPTAYIPKPASVSGVLGLSASDFPTTFESDNRVVRVPQGLSGAKTLKLSAAIAELSLVAQAGATLIVRPEQDKAIPTGLEGAVALQRVASSFNTVEAAAFSTVADDEDVPTSDLPVLSAGIDWSQSSAMAVRFEVDRAYQKEVGTEFAASELLFSIVLGVAHAVDASLLAAIEATSPALFSLGAVAAQGIRFSELRALVGTAGNGAVVNQNGDLQAAGVSAELTRDMVGTLAGAFNRAAVAIHDEIFLHVERRNTQGDLSMIAWVNLVPLVPNTASFFSVGS